MYGTGGTTLVNRAGRLHTHVFCFLLPAAVEVEEQCAQKAGEAEGFGTHSL